MLFSRFLLATGMTKLSLAVYSVKDEYSGENFFNMFNFDTVYSPSSSCYPISKTHFLHTVL